MFLEYVHCQTLADRFSESFLIKLVESENCIIKPIILNAVEIYAIFVIIIGIGVDLVEYNQVRNFIK